MLPNAEWFTEGGVTPDGRWWIVPTSLFIRQIWHGCAGDDLKKRGFHLKYNGHTVGATQNTVIYLPTTLIEKEEPSAIGKNGSQQSAISSQ
jgi:hypothetical protein